MPQFVLSAFTGDDKKLYQYDKATRQGEPRTTNGVGHAPRLYGVKGDDGRYDNRIEEYPGLIEHRAAPAVRTLRAGEQPTDEELFRRRRRLVWLWPAAGWTSAATPRVASLRRCR